MEETKLSFSKDDLDNAKETSLTQLASRMGFTPKKIGHCYTLKEMDSIRIYNDRTWFRWSGNGSHNGGTQIDFLMEFGNVRTVPEAVHELMNFQGISPSFRTQTRIEERPREFILPEKAKSYRIAYAYLMKTRSLSKEVIDYFVNDQKILYESKDYHNLVFLGKDADGKVKFASKRGTRDLYGQKYKGDVAGNDKNYGVNIVNKNNSALMVFEAAIDCMSYIDITGDYSSNKLILGMVSDGPLITFLKENPNIKEIGFCLDNDIAASKVIYGEPEIRNIDGSIKSERKIGYIEEYTKQGYVVKDNTPPKIANVKDYNDLLKFYKHYNPEKVVALNVRSMPMRKVAR